MTEQRSEIDQLGEFGLIERIGQRFTCRNPSSVKGIGDDAAVIASGSEHTLLATDMLTEWVHFDLSYVPLKHLGYKSIAVNVSDIVAMNGTPHQVTVNLGLSNRFSIEAVDALYEGIAAACESYRVDLVGGDTTSSRAGLVISVTAVGSAKKNQTVYRSGAQIHDILCVTGDLGSAYVGLQLLEREKQVFLADSNMQPQLDRFEYMVGRQLKPEARMDIIHELADLNVVPTAMIDISDGLASESLHLSRQSGVGVQLFEDKIPIDSRTYQAAAVDLKLDPLTCALNGGEDYELLFTIQQGDFEKIKNHPDIHYIGHMHDATDKNVMVSKAGTVVPLRAQGWTQPRHAPAQNKNPTK